MEELEQLLLWLVVWFVWCEVFFFLCVVVVQYLWQHVVAVVVAALKTNLTKPLNLFCFWGGAVDSLEWFHWVALNVKRFCVLCFAIGIPHAS